ncbi:MAG: phosphotransferase family protein [Acidimicrobiia bacterium]|nr:phosphotransferase family protein [Acidimicrobiia bacterium]
MGQAINGIDTARVSAWLAGHIDGVEPPFEFELIVGGRSNLTFAVTDRDGRRFVLRRPPTGAVLATAHDMAREHRIISAVGLTDVPVAPALGLCVDEEVNGAPFYVMDFVDGVVLDGPERAEFLTPEVRRAAADDLIDVLADLHAVDVDEIGLGNLARRTGYVERQVRRWSTQWEKSRTRELPAIDEVAGLLARRFPEQIGVSIAHGDYRFGNCLIDPDDGRVRAVLDWELCTLGDPLADVGYLGVYWTDPGDERDRTNDPTGLDGFPTYSEMVERYARRTGRDVSEIDYYVAFGSFRLAVISEGVYARYVHGAMGDQEIDPEMLAGFKAGTEQLAESALAAMRRST